MKLREPVNAEYSATIIVVKTVVPLKGRDRIVGMPMMGTQSIVGLDTQPGDIGILFPAGTQLSQGYCRENNLMRTSALNRDETKRGYLEDSRRVKAVKLGVHRSDALFMPLESLAEFGIKLGDLSEGDTFDHIGDQEVCRKYVVRHQKGSGGNGRIKLEPSKKRAEKKYIPEHFSTTNYFRVEGMVDGSKRAVITQKLHGTSVRVANMLVERKLSLFERLRKKFKLPVLEMEYAVVCGSRRVIKDVNNPNQIHYYGVDLWSEWGGFIGATIPKGFVVYGEIIGWKDVDSPLFKDYTYNVPPGQRRLYIYRIAQVNEDGVSADLSWDAVKEFCNINELHHVPELEHVDMHEFNANNWIDLAVRGFSDISQDAVPLSEGGAGDEGVCIRIEGIVPQIYKIKSPAFVMHESKAMDNEQVDIEEAQGGDQVQEEDEG
jgi:hypothetical protein